MCEQLPFFMLAMTWMITASGGRHHITALHDACTLKAHADDLRQTAADKMHDPLAVCILGMQLLLVFLSCRPAADSRQAPEVV